MKKRKPTLSIARVKSFVRCPRCFWEREHGISTAIYMSSGADSHQLALFRKAYFDPQPVQREIVRAICAYGETIGIPKDVTSPSIRNVLELIKDREFFDKATRVWLTGKPDDCFRRSRSGSYIPVIWKLCGSFREETAPADIFAMNAYGLLFKRDHVKENRVPVKFGGMMCMIPEGPRKEWQYKLDIFPSNPEHALKTFRAAVNTFRGPRPLLHVPTCELYKPPKSK